MNRAKREHRTHTPRDISDLWQTPPYIFKYLDKHMLLPNGKRGFHFKLDACAADNNHLVDTYYTKDNSCLDNPWIDASFCNPPYSDIMPFAEACVRNMNELGVTSVFLVPADCSTKWFKYAYENCAQCIMINKRLSFHRADTNKPMGSFNKGSALFIFSPHLKFKQKMILVDRDAFKIS